MVIKSKNLEQVISILKKGYKVENCDFIEAIKEDSDEKILTVLIDHMDSFTIQ